MASSKQRSDMNPPHRYRRLSSGFTSPTSSSFSTSPSTFFTRSLSSTHLNASSTSVSFAVDRLGSPGRSISYHHANNGGAAVSAKKKACLCSPTTHPGSFRCALHKKSPRGGAGHSSSSNQTSSYHSSIRLNYRRSAMKNSLVRIGRVEGDLMKRALAALIRPTSHNQRRLADFQPRSTRLSHMSKAGDGS